LELGNKHVSQTYHGLAGCRMDGSGLWALLR
jgi:hypothetical protein